MTAATWSPSLSLLVARSPFLETPCTPFLPSLRKTARALISTAQHFLQKRKQSQHSQYAQIPCTARWAVANTQFPPHTHACTYEQPSFFLSATRSIWHNIFVLASAKLYLYANTLWFSDYFRHMRSATQVCAVLTTLLAHTLINTRARIWTLSPMRNGIMAKFQVIRKKRNGPELFEIHRLDGSLPKPNKILLAENARHSRSCVWTRLACKNGTRSVKRWIQSQAIHTACVWLSFCGIGRLSDRNRNVPCQKQDFDPEIWIYVKFHPWSTFV